MSGFPKQTFDIEAIKEIILARFDLSEQTIDEAINAEVIKAIGLYKADKVIMDIVNEALDSVFRCYFSEGNGRQDIQVAIREALVEALKQN